MRLNSVIIAEAYYLMLTKSLQVHCRELLISTFQWDVSLIKHQLNSAHYVVTYTLRERHCLLRAHSTWRLFPPTATVGGDRSDGTVMDKMFTQVYRNCHDSYDRRHNNPHNGFLGLGQLCLQDTTLVIYCETAQVQIQRTIPGDTCIPTFIITQLIITKIWD